MSDRPMKDAVPFQSPKELAVTLELPHRGTVRGMGVTLTADGGYHGKSTLLKALERGVYDHIAGDGREYVITDASATNFMVRDELMQAVIARKVEDVVAALMKLMKEKGLGAVCGGGVVPAGLTMPRMQEIFACFDRY